MLETIFGGKFVHYHTSSTCAWYKWRRTRDHWFARKFDGWINPV